MDEEQHRQLRLRAERDEVLIGIDRPAARTFYTNVSLSRMRELTGESPLATKAAVMAAFVCGPLFLLGAIVLAFFAFGWWALAVAPAAIVIYFMYHGTSSLGSSRLLPITFVVAAVGVVWLVGIVGNASAVAAAFLLSLSLWCSRFLYVGATTFLRFLVLRSPRAFEALEEVVTVRDAD
jgi:hypothetical protein